MLKRFAGLSLMTVVLFIAPSSPPLDVAGASFAVGVAECDSQTSPCTYQPNYTCVYNPPQAPLQETVEYDHACDTPEYDCETFGDYPHP